jgi:Fe-S oxidoreductase
VFNTGKIVRTPPMDDSLRFALNQQSSPLLKQIERCNGSGDCRKSNIIGGTMCPAYKVSGDELMTTRARANILRELLSTNKIELLQSADLEILSSCLACKACKSECPSNIDMTRIRAQVLQHVYDLSHVPFRTWMIAHQPIVEKLGSLVPALYNFFATNSITSFIIKKIVHFATERHIPALSRRTMRWLIAHDGIVNNKSIPVTNNVVYLFADEFINYQEAEIGLTFARLLRKLGYQIVVPKHVESGRAAISKGCLNMAAKIARKNVELLAPYISADSPLIGIEPSCILSFRDEYLDLMPTDELRKKAKDLASNCLLFDEFLCREIDAGKINPAAFQTSDIEIFLHGHCHQKALVGVEKTARLLQYVAPEKVHVIPSGCCGMAGSFGYEKEHYSTSMAIGEMILFPVVRKALQGNNKKDIPVVVAPGISCREQILQGTGVHALHPITVLYNSLIINQ